MSLNVDSEYLRLFHCCHEAEPLSTFPAPDLHKFSDPGLGLGVESVERLLDFGWDIWWKGDFVITELAGEFAEGCLEHVFSSGCPGIECAVSVPCAQSMS